MAYFAQIIITSWRAEVRAASRWGSSPRYEDPQAQLQEGQTVEDLELRARRPEEALAAIARLPGPLSSAIVRLRQDAERYAAGLR